MINKPSMIVGASQGGYGTVRAQVHLRQILNSGAIKTLNLPGNEVLIGNIQDKMDEVGYIIDESTIKHLDKVVKKFYRVG